MNKRGPKGSRILIDWDVFEKLCKIQCTLEEVASYFDCSADTIERQVKKHYKKNFAEVFTQKKSSGNISLRRKSWELALAGNTRMLVHLTKNYLGMVDKVETKNEHSGPNGQPITFIDVIRKLEACQKEEKDKK